MSKKYVGTHSFAKSRHTKESQYSYFTGTWDNLERLVENHLHDKTPAAVPGAFIVSLPTITPYSHFGGQQFCIYPVHYILCWGHLLRPNQ